VGLQLVVCWVTMRVDERALSYLARMLVGKLEVIDKKEGRV
jgi:hypothetical protein